MSQIVRFYSSGFLSPEAAAALVTPSLKSIIDKIIIIIIIIIIIKKCLRSVLIFTSSELLYYSRSFQWLNYWEEISVARR